MWSSRSQPDALTARDDSEASIPLNTFSAQAEHDHQHQYDHGKHTKWVEIPLRRILYALLALVAGVVITFTVLGSVWGVRAYNRLAFPHRAVHASAVTSKDGTRVVKPYFAPTKSGGVSRGNLLIKVWFREGVDLEPVPDDKSADDYWQKYYQRYEDEERASTKGELGFAVPEKGNQNAWEEVWTGQLKNLDIESSRDVVNKVVVPGHIVHSLVTNHRSALVATFELLPALAVSPSINTDYSHNSTRPVDLYGLSQPWPLPYSASAPPISTVAINAFLAHSSVGRVLHVSMPDWRKRRGPWDPTEYEPYLSFLETRTLVTMARDYSIYSTDGFESAMKALKDFKQNCANSTYYWPDCYRTFDRDGHFENLLVAESSGGQVEWKYGPFLTTRLSPAAKKDYIKLPEETELMKLQASEVQDITFDWHVTWSSISPAKLSLAPLTMDSATYTLVDDGSRGAGQYDKQELRSAFLGLSYNPESRPIVRGAMGVISVGLWYLSIPFVLHYWATRRVSTGIAMLNLTIECIVNLVCYIVTTALNFDGVSIFIFVVSIIGFILIALKQIYLILRPDFKLSKLEFGAHKLKIPYPIAIRFRQSHADEKKSTALDAQFDWRIRVLLVIVTFCVLRFAPSPPPIISAPQYADMVHGFGGASHWNPTVLSVIHLFNAVQGSVWLTSRLGQAVLNHRQKTFAGSHGITAYLLLASLSVSALTKIFIGWFGRAQLMQPFAMWDVVVLLVSGVAVVQAVMLPRVDQNVNEVID